MTTAFQFCYAKPEWMAALEGWHGIDQMCEDNPRLLPMFDRFAKVRTRPVPPTGGTNADANASELFLANSSRSVSLARSISCSQAAYR